MANSTNKNDLNLHRISRRRNLTRTKIVNDSKSRLLEKTQHPSDKEFSEHLLSSPGTKPLGESKPSKMLMSTTSDRKMEAQVNLIDQETTAKKHSINVDEPEPAPSEQPSYSKKDLNVNLAKQSPTERKDTVADLVAGDPESLFLEEQSCSNLQWTEATHLGICSKSHQTFIISRTVSTTSDSDFDLSGFDETELDTAEVPIQLPWINYLYHFCTINAYIAGSLCGLMLIAFICWTFFYDQLTMFNWEQRTQSTFFQRYVECIFGVVTAITKVVFGRVL